MTDRQFFQTFAIIIGILFFLKLALIGIAVGVASTESEEQMLGNKYAQQQQVERIQSRGQVAVREGAGGVSSLPVAEGPEQVPVAPGVQPAAGPAADAAPAGEDMAAIGQQTYESACFACHGTGAAGAPRIGDVEDWSARIAQGREVLIQHSLEGYMGQRGFMPPKGGQTHLEDDAVIAALDYMVSQSR
ncbi:MAG: c-type cytochrome [Gammaproteobacteria bacterium]